MEAVLPKFKATIICLFVLAVTLVSSQIIGTLYRMQHPYTIDGAPQLQFVVFTLFPLMLLITLIVVVVDVVRFFSQRRTRNV